jgi:hypothetical protein
LLTNLRVNHLRLLFRREYVLSTFLYNDQLKKGEMGRTCSMNGGGEKRNAYRILVGKARRRRPLGRYGHRWEDNIKMDDRMGCYGLDSSGSGWEPVEGSCERGNEPWGSIKYWKILE